jgi:D-alanine-D-alanine ligase
VAFAKNKASFDEGLREALRYDSKVIIEEKVVGRELECAVLGNHTPIASIPGEVEPTKDFYSYESKYLDEKGAILHIPAQLTEEQVLRIQKLSIEVFKVLECRGMSRVDMFLTKDDNLVINEINTIPGFTNISMYPKLWELSGIPQQELISRLINLAIEEHTINNNLKLT